MDCHGAAAAHRERTEMEYEIERILDVRGGGGTCTRYYLVEWSGYDAELESTWEGEADIINDAAGVIEDFWTEHQDLRRAEAQERDGEHRCTECCHPTWKSKYVQGVKTLYGKGSIFETIEGLRRHQARCVGCKSRS
eukprot:SAG11_NODE_8907_length_964_cov_1.041618_2_plen_136_part_01